MGKIKNTEGSAMSVGSVAVDLIYGLYVGHLSKWFVFVFMFKFWSVSRLWNDRPTIGYNVLKICAEMALLAEPLSHRTKLDK